MSQQNLKDFENMIQILNSSNEYKVLRKLSKCRSARPIPKEAQTKIGIFLDIETTGIDYLADEIIQLVMIPFIYGTDGTIYKINITNHFSSLNQPSKPLPEKIAKLTGLSDDMLQGQKIDIDNVESFIDKASLIIAHNAQFDRRFLERLCPAFTKKPWACSAYDIDWEAEGAEGRKLPYLAMLAGFFYQAHNALYDCLAGIELLHFTLPVSGVPVMAKLLENARKPSVKITADRAPFEAKDLLKSRGYKWDAIAKAWYTYSPYEQADTEIKYLWESVYHQQVNLPTQKITAFERFSIRA